MALINLKSLSGIITLLYAVIYGLAVFITSIKSAIEVKKMRLKREKRMETDDPDGDRYNNYDEVDVITDKEDNDINDNHNNKQDSTKDINDETKQESQNEDIIITNEPKDTNDTQDNEQQPLPQEKDTTQNESENENDTKETEMIKKKKTLPISLDGTNNHDEALEFHKKIEKRVSRGKLAENELYHKNIIAHWAKLIYAKKRVYMSLVPHIFDQATDFGVMVEYYRFYASGKASIGHMKPFYLFWTSVFIVIISRTISAITVWVVTNNLRDTILQIFDLLIMKAVFISYKIDAKKPTTMQRYLQLLEAIFETSPQLVLSMVFVLKSTDNNSEISPVIIISLLTSIASLTLKVISDDKMIFKKPWEDINFQYKTIKYKCCCKKPKDGSPIPVLLNPRYIFRAFLRFVEITSRISILTLTWVVIGGFALLIILIFEFIMLFFFCYKLKKPDPLGMIIYSWFKLQGGLQKYLTYFHYYRAISSFLYLLVITIFIFVPFEAWKVEEAYVRKQSSQGLGMIFLIYGWISVPLWLIIWYIIDYKMEGISWGGRVVRDPGEMARGNNFQDLAELFEFGCTKAYTSDSAWWTAWKLLDIKCSMTLFIRIAPHLTNEYPNIWNAIGPFKRTPLMERYYQVEKIKYIVSKFADKVDLNVKSENKKDEGYILKRYVEDRHQFKIYSKLANKTNKVPKEKLSEKDTEAFLKFLDAKSKHSDT